MKWAILLLFLFSSVLASSDCGVRLENAGETVTRHRRIVGGNVVATPGKWPWQVKLLIRRYNQAGNCGGTVVSDRWILTAAHCVWDARYKRDTVEDVVVIAEVTNSSSESIINSLLNKHTYRAVKVIPHEIFTDKSAENDIALLKLESPLKLDHLVSPICLPCINQDVPHDGQAVATGFGISNIRGSSNTKDINDKMLRETILPIVREDICETRYKNSSVVKTIAANWTKIHKFCAGSMGHRSSNGDSGGPLMMKANDGRWFQIGITSFGDSYTNEADLHPTVYTDVREYCEWIDEKTNGEVKCQEEPVTLQDVEINV